MTIGIKLTTPYKDFRNKTLRAMAAQVNERVKNKKKSVESEIRKVVLDALLSSSAVHSLKDNSIGSLRSHFGIEKVGVVDDLMSKFVNSIELEIRPARRQGNNLSCKYKKTPLVKLRSMSIREFVELPEAQYISENGYEVPWMEWLLTRGDAIILRDYYIQEPVNRYERRHFSRTGLSMMRPRGKTGRRWGVPSEYAGVEKDNFITREYARVKEHVKAKMAKVIM